MRTGYAVLPLHHGRAPKWLFEKMVRLARAISSIIIEEFGRRELLLKLSDPFWFQAFGCVLGFDWHSSGLTTTTMGALKEGLRSVSKEYGVFICGGKGRIALSTPQEIEASCGSVGMDPLEFIYASRMAAKVDNTALQDGYSIYHHTFVFTVNGDWCVVQQGLKEEDGTARRYHWLNPESFVEDPHRAVCSEGRGDVVNFVAKEIGETRDFITRYVRESSSRELKSDLEALKKLELPRRHYITLGDFDPKRLQKSIEKLKENPPSSFEELLSRRGLGPKTLRALGLVSELIYGNELSYRDPARFSFAHGGKDGHPYPVDRSTYEKTISYLELVLRRIRSSPLEKERAMRRLLRWASGKGGV